MLARRLIQPLALAAAMLLPLAWAGAVAAESGAHKKPPPPPEHTPVLTEDVG